MNNGDEWVSVKDRLPKTGERVLTWPGYTVAYHVPSDEWSGWYDNHGNNHMCGVTHWMPLPEPPEPQLAACPFCGNSMAEVITNDNWSYVVCAFCDSRGSEICGNSSPHDAIIAWNTRIGASE